MKLNYFFALLLLCQLSFAQTGKHVAVPGTKCSIIPPDGFFTADNFSGFFNEETGASIMITEIPAPYSTLVGGFTAEALKTKGITLIEKKPVDFNGTDATFFIVKQPANGVMYQKQILMFGASGSTILVNAIYPEDAKSIGNTLKTSLFSTVYNSGQNIDPLDAVNFTVHTEGTVFKVVKGMPGSVLFSMDGQLPTNKPTLIVGNSLSKVPAMDKKQFAEEYLRQLHIGESTIIKSTNPVTIDKMPGYEIVAEGKNKLGSNELIYQVILFNEAGDYYIFVGNTAEEKEKNLVVYRSILKTFKRKF